MFTVGLDATPIVPLLLMERVDPVARRTISDISYKSGALFGGVISALLIFVGE